MKKSQANWHELNSCIVTLEDVRKSVELVASHLAEMPSDVTDKAFIFIENDVALLQYELTGIIAQMNAYLGRNNK